MLAMEWSTLGQRIAVGDDVFAHAGPIHTDPSHDCAHLLVAACGTLPWKPEGESRSVRLAEYNATVLEHLLDTVHNCVCLQSVRRDAVQPVVERLGEWFVTRHFAPFPVSAAEARRLMGEGLDVDAVVRLSPHFFTLKRAERRSPRQLKSGTVTLAFDRADDPAADTVNRQLRVELREQLRRWVAPS
jgi:hypothetical protein